MKTNHEYAGDAGFLYLFEASTNLVNWSWLKMPPAPIAVRFVPLWALQRLHAQAKFGIAFTPACWRAITCSTWNGPENSSQSGNRQYSQRPPARVRTCCRTRGDIRPVPSAPNAA